LNPGEIPRRWRNSTVGEETHVGISFCSYQTEGKSQAVKLWKSETKEKEENLASICDAR
jgi:hypothetical protein